MNEMTRLDEIALVAMCGMLSDSSRDNNFSDLAKNAYFQAMAMIKEGKKHENQP